ncbi:phosphoribosylamine--glycine ligase [Limisphaera ngatamarikiensis]|uniref:phosphoribosylamine--glycine ligase n=1 Tax=Limisphaera ngatamarikiensis TaxID=1324935 RepID=A0A6M1RHY1_9BACT|nr:phosphoribosylglycinamide synthetase C domain-containing protein [Limisphaera ngatamarikiensis]NGO39668.1 phosphoribosylamine--glycine ligase [Limisphaera ngatamarikiensis]
MAEPLPASPGDDRGALVLGVGSFAHSTASILRDDGVRVATYLTRDYAHWAPSLAGPTYSKDQYPSPMPLLRSGTIHLVIPQSIDWARAPWAEELIRSGVPILCPTGEGLRLERERDFARALCQKVGIPFPTSVAVKNRQEALAWLASHPAPYVIKNPLCGPFSPVHTIVCESPEATRAWLERVDDREGLFLQEYMGRAEIGHIVLVSAGQVWSLVTNQEYKRAFTGNLGIVAGAPLGGVVEADPEDRYGLARTLVHPLLPWLREVGFHGPLQVTAARLRDRWWVLEYNVRIGVTSGAMFLRMLANPWETLHRTARNLKLDPRFVAHRRFGCSITLAGYGYPYVQLTGPEVPVEIAEPLDTEETDLWWNEVRQDNQGRLWATGHRLADVIGFGPTLETAVSRAYNNIRRIRSPGSYYRTDIGRCLWPPGSE